MGQLSRYLSHKPDYPSSTPRSHVKVEERTNFTNVYSDHLHAMACIPATHDTPNTCMYMHMHMHTTHTTPRTIWKILIMYIFHASQTALELRCVHPPTLLSSFGLLSSLVLPHGMYNQPDYFWMWSYLKLCAGLVWIWTSIGEHHHLNFVFFHSMQCNTEINCDNDL